MVRIRIVITSCVFVAKFAGLEVGLSLLEISPFRVQFILFYTSVKKHLGGRKETYLHDSVLCLSLRQNYREALPAPNLRNEVVQEVVSVHNHLFSKVY